MSNGAWSLIAVSLACAIGVAGCNDDGESFSSLSKAARERSKPRKPARTDLGSATTGASEGPAASWTMMGGDARNQYFNRTETKLGVDNAKDLKLKWSFEVAGFPPGSPVVAGGRVYVMATGGSYAIELDSGAQVWKRDDIVGTASVAYDKGFVYLHSARAQLYKLDAKDGSTVWGPIRTYELESCDGTSSPVIAGDKVIVGHSCGIAEVTGNKDQAVARGGVEAFSTDAGSRLWTYWTVPESGENGAMVWSTVAVDPEAKLVFATTGNNYTLLGENSDAFHAIDLETGTRVWKHQVRDQDVWSIGSSTFTAPTGPSIDTDFGANPILAELGDRKLVAAGDKASAFWALDRMTGELVWGREELSARHTPNNGGVLMNGAFDGKNFYAAVNEPPTDSLLRVLGGEDGEDVHEPVRLGAIVWGALSLANGLLFVPVNSVLQVYDAETLELLVSLDTGGTIAAGAAVVVDGNVVVKSGLMYRYARDAMANNKVLCYSTDGAAADGVTSGGEKASAEPTWTAVYDEIIVGTGCSGAGLCHGGEVGGGMLTFKSKDEGYAALIDVKAMGKNAEQGMGADCKDTEVARVVAGDPDSSLLVQKLEGTQACGGRMPPGSQLTDAQIQQVRSWVQRGALND